MASRVFSTLYDSGQSVYLRIFNMSGQVFDFNDETFKSLGSATTPYIACTEQADVDGTGRSAYVVTIDLDDIYSGFNPADFRFNLYANGTPAAGDVAFAASVVRLPEDIGQIDCRAEGVLTSTAGTEIRITASLERNGQVVVLGSGSVSMGIREHGASSNLLTLSSSSLTALGRFEITQSNPGFTDDRLYMARVAITTGGVTYTSDVPFPILG